MIEWLDIEDFDFVIDAKGCSRQVLGCTLEGAIGVMYWNDSGREATKGWYFFTRLVDGNNKELIYCRGMISPVKYAEINYPERKGNA